MTGPRKKSNTLFYPSGNAVDDASGATDIEPTVMYNYKSQASRNNLAKSSRSFGVPSRKGL